MQWLSWASPALSCQETALHLAFQTEPHSKLAISITACTSSALQNPLCCSSRSRAYIESSTAASCGSARWFFGGLDVMLRMKCDDEA